MHHTCTSHSSHPEGHSAPRDARRRVAAQHELLGGDPALEAPRGQQLVRGGHANGQLLEHLNLRGSGGV